MNDEQRRREGLQGIYNSCTAKEWSDRHDSLVLRHHEIVDRLLREVGSLNDRVAKKDAVISSLVAEREYVTKCCCKVCRQMFDGENEDASILIKEWEEGKR